VAEVLNDGRSRRRKRKGAVIKKVSSWHWWVVSYVIVERPDVAANWQLRFQFQFLFPN
jgi:hypothetical protein